MKEYRVMINFNPVKEDSPNENSEFPASMAPIIFRSYDQKLIGSFLIASGEGPHPTVILLHGFPGNELNYDLAHSIRRFGFNVMVFHYRGSWGSEGEFTFKNGINDVASAIGFLKSEYAATNFRVDKEKIILVGHSFGGFAALLNIINYDNIKHVASLAGFNFGYFAQFTEQDAEIKSITLESLALGTELLTNANFNSLYNEFVEHQVEWNLLNLKKKLKNKSILIVGAENDTVSPKEIHHIPLVKTLKDSSNKVEDHLINSGHSFSSKRIKLNEIVIDWIRRIKF